MLTFIGAVSKFVFVSLRKGNLQEHFIQIKQDFVQVNEYFLLRIIVT